MGIFNRKKDRVYSLSEAMKLLQTKKYENYTTIPEDNGYRLVPMQQLAQVVQGQEEMDLTNTKRNNFLNRMTKGVETQEFTKVPNYNNYQESKGYRHSKGISR